MNSLRLRIGISGPGGCGKTTLSKMLSKKLSLPIIPEGVRDWLQRHGFQSPWVLSWKEQLELQQEYIMAKIQLESTYASFISDRTTIDAVALLCLRAQLNCRYGLPNDIVKLALDHAVRTYDIAIILKWNQLPFVFDGVRTFDPILCQKEYLLVTALYEYLSIPLVLIPHMPAARVLPYVMERIRAMCRWVRFDKKGGVQ